MVTDESEEFFRDFEIKGDQTFFDFHIAIQNELDYDSSQLASFFISNDKWDKGKEITLLEMGEDEMDNKILMENAEIANYINKKKQRLLYLFDLFNDRSFYLELIESREEVTPKRYPICIEGRGDAPRQVILDEDTMEFEKALMKKEKGDKSKSKEKTKAKKEKAAPIIDDLDFDDENLDFDDDDFKISKSDDDDFLSDDDDLGFNEDELGAEEIDDYTRDE